MAIGARTVASLRSAWSLLSPDDLDGTYERWMSTAVPIIVSGRVSSFQLAAAYVSAFKRLEVGTPAPSIELPPVPTAAIRTSLTVTGPGSVKRAMTRGVGLDRAMAVAEAASSAAGMRHALDAGREAVLSSVRSDPDSLGWQRIASGDACDYCSGLTGIRFPHNQVFRPHDGCSCSAAPVYR